MTIVIPSSMRAAVIDLEDTLVCYPVTEDEQAEYQPTIGAIAFLDRCYSRFEKNGLLIFSTASAAKISEAYFSALQKHKALTLGLWDASVLKPIWSEFAKHSKRACESLGIAAENLCYIDDNPAVCLNAVKFGFGFVICLNSAEALAQAISNTHTDDLRKIDDYLENAKLVFTDSLDQVFFENAAS